MIREAIEKIKNKYPAESYKLIGHNCQNFVSKVRNEYKKIEKNKERNKK